MKKIISQLIIVAILISSLTGCGKRELSIDQFAQPKEKDTVAEIVIRDYGSIFIRFFEDAAPKAVENFVTHAKNGYYNGLTFHRILEDFMIQGGDPKGDGTGGESIWGKEFEDEFADDLHPYRGALCMANSGPDSNGSQFFIVQSSETYTMDVLKQIEKAYGTKFDEKAIKNYGELGGTPWLYKAHTVFGQVYDGYEVLDAVAKVELRDEKNGIPETPVVIDKIIISEY